MAAEPKPGLHRLKIRPMKRRHLNQVLTIENLAESTRWSRSIFLSELLYADQRSYVVAKLGRMVVGYAGVMFAPDEGHVTKIAVHPDYQRRGIATLLMVELIRTTIDRGYDAMTLEARVANEEAQDLYRKLGFVSVGVRPEYYAETREDAVIMWAHEIRGSAYRTLLDGAAARYEGGAR